jgi:chemotaxis protein histidine kinase CheA
MAEPVQAAQPVVETPLKTQASVPEKVGGDVTALFADEVSTLTEAQLMGEDVPPEGSETPAEKETVTPPPKGEDKKEGSEEKKQDEMTEEEKIKADTDAKAKEENEIKTLSENQQVKKIVDGAIGKATEGIRAELSNTRKTAQKLHGDLTVAHETIATLETRLAESSARPVTEQEDEQWKDFKVLASEEEKAMDVEERLDYRAQLDEFRQYQNRKKEQEQHQKVIENAKKKNMQVATNLINTCRDAMAQEIPGLFDEGNTVGDELIEFAQKYGINPDFFTDLTDPGALLSRRGEGGTHKKPVYLAKGAVSLVSGMFKLMKQIREGRELTEVQLEEARQKGREEATKQFTEKYKETGISLGDLSPGGKTVIDDNGQIFTEEQFRNMSEEEKRKYLGG